MPFRVLTDREGAPASSGAFSFAVELWPHQSLTGVGFVWVIAATFAMLCIPLIGLLGTAVLWGVLPFAMGALALLWLAVKRNWRDRDILETFTLNDDIARLVREEAHGPRREWQANPYWVRVARHDKVGQVEDYLTLLGGPREVEIGAFLTPSERRELEGRLRRALRHVREPRP